MYLNKLYFKKAVNHHLGSFFGHKGSEAISKYILYFIKSKINQKAEAISWGGGCGVWGEKESVILFPVPKPTEINILKRTS